MIRGAIFDIDGTLLDSMDIWNDLGEKYLARQGIPAEKGLGEILFPMTLEESAVYLKEQYRLPFSPGEIKAGVLQVVENFYRQEVSLKPGMEALVRSLAGRGVPMVLATTGSPELAEAALRRLGLWQYFRGLLTTSELGTSKREPLIYRKAAELLGTVPEETAVYEDVIHALRTAKQAGFYTVGVFDRASAADWDEIRRLADEVIENR